MTPTPDTKRLTLFDRLANRRYLTLTETAAALGISLPTLNRWVRAGRKGFPKPANVGAVQELRFLAADVQHWFDRHYVELAQPEHVEETT